MAGGGGGRGGQKMYVVCVSECILGAAANHLF